MVTRNTEGGLGTYVVCRDYVRHHEALIGA